MALTLANLRDEFFERGFEYLDDGGPGLARANRWLNRAMHKIDGAADWPYLNTTATGAAPLLLADLRTVEDVYDSTNRQPLAFVERRALRSQWGDLTITGRPSYYYITAGNTINAFPVQAVTLIVDYWKFDTTDMVNDIDEPMMPDRFRLAIVEYAVADSYRDDESVDAATAKAAAEEIVGEMRDVLIGQQHSGAPWIVPAVGSDC